MQVKEVMSSKPEYLDFNATIQDAARKMKEKGVGSVPIGKNDKLVGMLTDRDIAIQVVAEGKAYNEKVGNIAKKDVLYCFENDDVKAVLQNMKDQQVQRLIVLKDKEHKDFVGIVTVADIANKCADDADLSQAIAECSRHYH